MDHTAEVLENYRRIQENKIFDKILHDERNKKAFLKHESRKVENLIEGFENRYANYKYLQDTSNQFENFKVVSQNEFIDEDKIFRDQRKLKDLK